jgi:putative DNA primase/helicase
MTSQRGRPREWEYLAFWQPGGGGLMDLGETLGWLPSDDQSAALVIMNERKGELRYTEGKPGTWHIWDETCHRPDDSGAIGKIAVGFGWRLQIMLERAKQQVYTAAAIRLGSGASFADVDKAAAEDFKSWLPGLAYAKKLRGNTGVNALIGYLSKLAGVSPADLAERHPHWLNCENGTVDLATGELRPHDPEDMITYCVPVGYRPELAWKCPLFLSLVHRMCGGDEAVYEYVLRLLGYCLLGDNPEQVMGFWCGPTASGKSLVLGIVRDVLGGALAIDSKADLITHVPAGRNARVENSIRGRRLVTISELREDMRIDDGQVKRITGEREIAVDKHYATDRTPTPVTFTVVGSTNEMPSAPQVDSALARRAVVVPTGPSVPEGQRETGMAGRVLAAEREAILATLIHSARLYFRDGLPRPEAVAVATETWCGTQDTGAAFARDQLDTGLGWDACLPMTSVLRAYRDWGKDLGMPLLGTQAFYARMEKLPGIARDDNSGSRRLFRGVRWKGEAEVMLP